MPELLNLKKIISRSSLTEKECEEFVDLFVTLPKKILKEVINLFSANPEYVEPLFCLYLDKKQATKSGDKNAWEQIIRNEFQTLAMIEKSAS